MSKTSVMIQLEPEQIDALDQRSRRDGVSRSHLIRQAVDEMLAPSTDDDLGARYAAAYSDQRFGVDAWGDVDAWHAAAAEDRAIAERDPW